MSWRWNASKLLQQFFRSARTHACRVDTRVDAPSVAAGPRQAPAGIVHVGRRAATKCPGSSCPIVAANRLDAGRPPPISPGLVVLIVIVCNCAFPAVGPACGGCGDW